MYGIMMKSFVTIGLSTCLAFAFASLSGERYTLAGRYEEFTKQFAQGEKATVVSATFFGGPDAEELVAAGERSDGRIVVAGNAWGPKLPEAPTVVLGKGAHTGDPGTTPNKKGNSELNAASRDRAGLILVYSKDLKKLERIIRFDWGVASVQDICVLDDDSLLLVGKTGANAGSIKAQPNLAYIAHLGDKGLNWIQTVEGYSEPATRLWQTKFGIYFRSQIKNESAMFRIGLDGKGLKRLAVNAAGNGVSDFHGVNPDTGEFYYGGDRNTHTGKEPWRQPFMYVFDKDGKQTDTLWNWPSKSLRTKGYPAEGDVSDSSIRGVAIHPKTGEVIVNGWSDGGNSVFKRQPKDIATMAGNASTSFNTYGMKGANSLAYVMRLNRKDWTVASWCYWVAYIPDDFAEQRVRGAPNYASITDLTVLTDGSIVFSGGCATGLIQTPGAFFKYEKDGSKHGGGFVAVQSPDQKELYFSSYMPGSDDIRLNAGRNGRLIVVSRNTGGMKRDNGLIPAPTVNACQPEFGGQVDGHILLLQVPSKQPVK